MWLLFTICSLKLIGMLIYHCRYFYIAEQFHVSECDGIRVHIVTWRTSHMHSTSTPFVSTPAPVVEQPGVHAKRFPTLWLVESPELLPSFGWSSPSPSPTLPWGAPRCRGEQRRTRRHPFRPTVYRQGPHRMLRTRTVCSLFHHFHRDSSFGFLEEWIASGWRGPIADDVRWLWWFGSGWSDHLCAVWTFSRVRIPIVVACVRVAVRFGLSAGFYNTSDCVGSGVLRPAGGGALDLCPSFSVGGGKVIGDKTAGLSVPILGVRRVTFYRWQPGIWIAASSSSICGAGGSSGVCQTSWLFTNVLGG